MGGLGAKEGPPALVAWRGIALKDSELFSAVFSLRALPWLAILALCLLKPNRRWHAWLLWLPLLAMAALSFGLESWLSFADSSVRQIIQFMIMPAAFGWAAALLLAPWAPWPRKFGRGGSLLLVLGVFALLGLAFGQDWGETVSDELMQMISAVALQFVILGLAAAACLAGWSARRRFTPLRFLGWLFLWLLLVWMALAIPSVALTSFGNGEVVVVLLILAGGCCLGSWVVTLPFLVLGIIHSGVRDRLQRVLLPPQPSALAPPEPQALHQAQA